ncbi:hypothetical protein QKW35_01185 [Pontibacterium granulatum]|uniref:hypothetical protein n=1 Tax=Pontibacterium granulatum TaxID=2036029 RepID=UPI00249CB573|nr:hypothetical protein [Pontibacterium granulatum]MDI3322975.1 hypothetical protein [Pontibacterium granulatum]
MKTQLLLAAGVLVLTGCASSSGLNSGYYTLDLERTELCYSDQNRCLNLELIIPSYNEMRIAQAYEIPTSPKGWDVEDLVTLMLAPPKKQYEAKQIGDYRYLIPRTYASNTVWRYLWQEQHELYETNGKIPTK